MVELERYNPLLGDPDTFFAQNMGLAYFFANRYANKLIRYGLTDEDTLQIVLEAMWSAYCTFDGRAEYSTYAGRTVLYRMRSLLRDLNTPKRRGQQTDLSLDYVWEGEDGSELDNEALVSVDNVYEDLESVMFLVGFLEYLDDTDRFVVRLKLKCVSQKDIASILHISQVTVGRRLRKIRNAWNEFQRA